MGFGTEYGVQTRGSAPARNRNANTEDRTYDRHVHIHPFAYSMNKTKYTKKKKEKSKNMFNLISPAPNVPDITNTFPTELKHLCQFRPPPVPPQ